MPDGTVIDYREIRRQAIDAEQAEIVSGHLAARRVQRRVIAICSVLAIAGAVMLGSVILTGPGPHSGYVTRAMPKL